MGKGRQAGGPPWVLLGRLGSSQREPRRLPGAAEWPRHLPAHQGLLLGFAQRSCQAARWSCILVSSLLLFQDNVLNIINQIMDACIPQDRAPRDFCVKFPEEIRHDNLAGQLWFGAEVAQLVLRDCPPWAPADAGRPLSPRW